MVTNRELVFAATGLAAATLLLPLTCYSKRCEYSRQWLRRLKGQKKRVAVLLSGCGVFDGSDVLETTSLLIQLSRENAEVTVFAPDKRQYDTIDYITSKDMGQNRNVMVEAARLSRGQIQNLSVLDVAEFDALCVPGGFGIAKNLSTYAANGQNYSIDSEVHKVLLAFTQAKKPIGLCCIAPVLIVKVIPGVQITIGSTKTEESWPYAEETYQNLIAAGAIVVEKNYDDICVDKANKIVTAPAYMHSGTPEQVYENLGAMVRATLKLA